MSAQDGIPRSQVEMFVYSPVSIIRTSFGAENALDGNHYPFAIAGMEIVASVCA